ncbi:MAG: hypothetical protein EOO56_12310 [Hymenobacter sp.]|nr:MAG: hypothetical protein EOO56_12310 [Hymenobacter sp.]
MQIFTPFRWLAALALWLGPLLAAHATHILGGEITYNTITSTTAGVPRYHILARLYRDTRSVAAGPTVLLTCGRGGCASTTPGSFTVTIPQTQAVASASLGCPGAALFSYEAILLYEADVDLPTGQWTLSLTEPNRVAGIVNLTNSVNSSFYISTYLDNSLAAQNSSPKFLSTLLPYLCNNQLHRYSFSAFDAEGDSLVYQFVQPEESPLGNGCSNPIAGTLSPHFLLDAATGALTTAATPTVRVGTYSMAVRVTEFRRLNGSWQSIGYVTRDVAYVVILSANQLPYFLGLRLSGAATPQPLGQPVRVQPGQTVALDLDATDPDATQALRFESQAPSVIPGLSLQTTSPTSAKLTWRVPTSMPAGRYTATVAVLDNGCPNASEEYTFTFGVAAQPLAGRAGQRAEAEAFPTPFREQVQFQTSAGSPAVLIFDALGRVVARLTSAADGRVRWQPAPTLPAGLYLARSADTGQPLARLLRAE